MAGIRGGIAWEEPEGERAGRPPERGVEGGGGGSLEGDFGLAVADQFAAGSRVDDDEGNVAAGGEKFAVTQAWLGAEEQGARGRGGIRLARSVAADRLPDARELVGDKGGRDGAGGGPARLSDRHRDGSRRPIRERGSQRFEAGGLVFRWREQLRALFLDDRGDIVGQGACAGGEVFGRVHGDVGHHHATGFRAHDPCGDGEPGAACRGAGGDDDARAGPASDPRGGGLRSGGAGLEVEFAEHGAERLAFHEDDPGPGGQLGEKKRIETLNTRFKERAGCLGVEQGEGRRRCRRARGGVGGGHQREREEDGEQAGGHGQGARAFRFSRIQAAERARPAWLARCSISPRSSGLVSCGQKSGR